jgi:hypothetical protein
MSVGYWSVAALVVLRAWLIWPSLAVRGAGAALAAVIFVLYLASTALNARRARVEGPSDVVDLIWTQGAAGLVLAAVLLSLI